MNFVPGLFKVQGRKTNFLKFKNEKRISYKVQGRKSMQYTKKLLKMKSKELLV